MLWFGCGGRFRISSAVEKLAFWWGEYVREERQERAMSERREVCTQQERRSIENIFNLLCCQSTFTQMKGCKIYSKWHYQLVGLFVRLLYSRVKYVSKIQHKLAWNWFCTDNNTTDRCHAGAGKVDPNAWGGRQGVQWLSFNEDHGNSRNRQTRGNIREPDPRNWANHQEMENKTEDSTMPEQKTGLIYRIN